jgi:hypothetical protein
MSITTEAVEMSSGSGLAVVDETATRRAKHGRSRATNHRDLLPYVKDGRLTEARRFRDLVRSMISDSGGVENCTEVRLGLIRRLAAATVLSEDIEAKAVNGEVIDIGAFCQLASTTVRLAQRLGVNERIPRQIEPTLADLIRADQAAQREQEAQQQ